MKSGHLRNLLPVETYQRRYRRRAEDARGHYFRDQTAIIHSLPFRRLKHKTQVFFSPKNDHVCTRIEHSLHVATIAATICKALGLDTELAYAIGLGHDLGHAPFGHAGEAALDTRATSIGGFLHEVHGLRVVDVLGNHGEGLNLTFAVRDGIVCHCGEKKERQIRPRDNGYDPDSIKDRSHFPATLEGCVARLSDRMAYIGRDLEDALYGGFIAEADIPVDVLKGLGGSNSRIIDTLVLDVIEESRRSGVVGMSEEKFELLNALYAFSAQRIYNHDDITSYKEHCGRIVGALFSHFTGKIDRYRSDWAAYSAESKSPVDRHFSDYLLKMRPLYEREKAPTTRMLVDYIAGMTDDFALRCMSEISLPSELNFSRAWKR